MGRKAARLQAKRTAEKILAEKVAEQAKEKQEKAEELAKEKQEKAPEREKKKQEIAAEQERKKAAEQAKKPTSGYARIIQSDTSHTKYDIDFLSKYLAGEAEEQSQLIPTTITTKSNRALGRQIAVGGGYIFHIEDDINIRITGKRYSKSPVATKSIYDLAFFEDGAVHLLASASRDGKLIVRTVDADDDGIRSKIIVSLTITANANRVHHPRLCWHPRKKVMLALGNCILKIDIEDDSSYSDIVISDELINGQIDGFHLVGKHGGEVTDLSICPGLTSYLASSSKDGTVIIWEDKKTVPLAILVPYDTKPVNSVAFLTGCHCPDHIVLITGGPRNHEFKIWEFESDGGRLLPEDEKSWKCTQSLTITGSSAFECISVFLPSAGLFLIANTKTDAIYAVSIEHSRMNLLIDYKVTEPTLSLTGTSHQLTSGEHVVKFYCVGREAVQQYDCSFSECTPLPDGTFSAIPSSSEVSCSTGAALQGVVDQSSSIKTPEESLKNWFSDLLDKKFEAFTSTMETAISIETDALFDRFTEENTERDKRFQYLLEKVNRINVEMLKLKLSTLMSERKYEEAFKAALYTEDVLFVCWLCGEVEVENFLFQASLSQPVLMSLLQQLSISLIYDEQTLTSIKWMKQVFMALDPTGPIWRMHGKKIFSEVIYRLGSHVLASGSERVPINSVKLIISKGLQMLEDEERRMSK